MAKRILFIRQNKPGGTDNYCKALCALFKDDQDFHPLPVENLPDIPSRLFHYYYRPAPLKRAIAQADIIHINGYTAMGTVQAILTAKKLKKRIIYTAHWHPFSYLRHPMLGRLFFSLFLRPIIKKYVHTVTTINNEDTRFFKKFHPHVVQIPHWYRPLPLQNSPSRKSNMILFVGRADDPVKGIEHLYHIPNNMFDIHCVGKGNITRKDFHQHINISDIELYNLYAEASVLVIPSKYEAFSYVALEALSYGTPVVMSERVRIADYLNGVKGVSVFQYENYQDFYEKTKAAIGGAVDIQSISQIFLPEEIKQRYSKIYFD